MPDYVQPAAGYLAAALFIINRIPQIMRLYARKSSGDFSLWSRLLLIAALATYCVATWGTSGIYAACVSLFMESGVTLMVIWYYDAPRPS